MDERERARQILNGTTLNVFKGTYLDQLYLVELTYGLERGHEKPKSGIGDVVQMSNLELRVLSLATKALIKVEDRGTLSSSSPLRVHQSDVLTQLFWSLVQERLGWPAEVSIIRDGRLHVIIPDYLTHEHTHTHKDIIGKG